MAWLYKDVPCDGFRGGEAIGCSLQSACRTSCLVGLTGCLLFSDHRLFNYFCIKGELLQVMGICGPPGIGEGKTVEKYLIKVLFSR